jgi:autotransporter-associated beta strand protein
LSDPLSGATGIVTNSGAAATLVTQAAGGSPRTFSGLIQDGGLPGNTLALTVSSGTLTLANTGNSYSGGTTVLGNGTLVIANDAVLGTGALTLGNLSDGGNSPGTLQIQAGTGTFQSSSRTINLVGVSSSGAGGIIDLYGNNAALGGLIQDGTVLGSPASGSLTVTDTSPNGGGVMTLTGNNTYTGGTTVTGGFLSGVGHISGGATLAVASEGNIGGASAGGLTLDGGTLRFLSGFTLNQPVTLGGSTSAGAVDLFGQTPTIMGIIGDPSGGSGTLIVNDTVGNGRLTLGGANSYSGGTVINAGTVAVSADNNLGNAEGSVTFGGGTLEFTQSFSSGRQLNLSYEGANNTRAFLQVDGRVITTLTGSIGDGDGAGRIQLVVSGGGTLVLNPDGSNNYGGGTLVQGATTVDVANDGALGLSTAALTLDNGILQIGGGGFFSARPVLLGAGGGTIDPAGFVDPNFSGPFQDASTDIHGALTINDSEGGGVVTLSSTINSYSGPTTVLNGTLRGGAPYAFSPKSQFRIDASEGSLGRLDLGGFDQTIGSLADGPNGSGIVTNSYYETMGAYAEGPKGGAALTESPGKFNTLTTGNDNQDSSFSGTIQDGDGPALALTKIGTGAFTLGSGGSFTYSGATTVQGGTLVVDGVLANTASLQVQSSATLTGAGSINAPVTVLSGGGLAQTAGQTLTMASLDLNAGSNVKVSLGTAGGPRLFDVTGDLTFGAGSNSVLLNVSNTPLAGVYRIFDYGGSLTNPNGFGAGSIGGGEPPTSTPRRRAR